MRVILGAILGFGLAVPGASAASLAQETDINQRLMEMSVADEIRKRCDSISARMFRGLGLMNELKAEAVARGYSEAEIEAYVKDREEKRKMRARADAYIRARGAEPNDGPSLCVLGRDEIEKQSRIGALLRAR
ncbi:DUF5333 domain-containing protein [Roseovarius sp. MBR-6]|jgi:hypothetical protein|uniref:DUF5333 domain-containing protein n=1 Tax=Roseovarius sp. MBR-6 TaxID=3156459 RepID=UPI000CBD18F4|nr:MAG: hypothetical protein CVT70_00610 [Alphaproteobacteria bacterium HGW-Alphaproteobacteria-1]